MLDETHGVEEEVEETTAQDAPPEEENDETSELGEDELNNTEESEEEEIDYRAELEAAQAKLERAEAKIVKNKKAKKSKKEEKMDLNEIVKKQVEAQLDKFHLSANKAIIETEINRLASTIDEAKLMRHHLQHTVRLTGNVSDDVENAKFLANKKRILRDNNELREAMKSKATRGSANYSGQKQVRNKSKFSSHELDFLKKYGYEPKKK